MVVRACTLRARARAHARAYNCKLSHARFRPHVTKALLPPKLASRCFTNFILLVGLGALNVCGYVAILHLDHTDSNNQYFFEQITAGIALGFGTIFIGTQVLVGV